MLASDKSGFTPRRKMRTRDELKQLQSLSLDIKIAMSKKRIQQWANEFGTDGVYVSFSGGKDSTVLLELVRGLYPDVEAVYVDTGLEYPEIRGFVKKFDNVTILRPKKNFKQVITEYGYPVISKDISGKTAEVKRSLELGNNNTVRYRQFMGVEKNDNGQPSEFNCVKYKFLLDAPFKISDKCCSEMKKKPFREHEKRVGKVPLIGQLSVESRLRQSNWIRYGCNAFGMKNPQSNPMSFWVENDVLRYIHENKLTIADVYGEVVVDSADQVPGQINIYDYLEDYRGCTYRTTGCDRTGCMFCLHGAHLEKGTGRLERMKKTHPDRYNFVMRGGALGKDGMWRPSKEGLGFKFVIDWLNENGNLDIRY